MEGKFSFLLALGYIAIPAATSSSHIIPEGISISGDTLGANVSTINYLGDVDGKSYFAEVNITMNWTSAVKYCKDHNLELASIETQNEADFLSNAIYSTYKEVNMWTSARERRDPEAFIWDSTDKVANGSVFTKWYGYSGGIPYYYCAFVGNERTDLLMFTRKCELTFNVLCQTPAEKIEKF